MSIPKFETFTSGAVPVEVENIDTDQIIPARFLKATERNLHQCHYAHQPGAPPA